MIRGSAPETKAGLLTLGFAKWVQEATRLTWQVPSGVLYNNFGGDNFYVVGVFYITIDASFIIQTLNVFEDKI